jgi:hypothetical protein
VDPVEEAPREPARSFDTDLGAALSEPREAASGAPEGWEPETREIPRPKSPTARPHLTAGSARARAADPGADEAPTSEMAAFPARRAQRVALHRAAQAVDLEVEAVAESAVELEAAEIEIEVERVGPDEPAIIELTEDLSIDAAQGGGFGAGEELTAALIEEDEAPVRAAEQLFEAPGTDLSALTDEAGAREKS